VHKAYIARKTTLKLFDRDSNLKICLLPGLEVQKVEQQIYFIGLTISLEPPSISSTFFVHFFVRMSFRQLFLRTYVEKKAAETTFVRKKRAKNIDEIDT